MIRVTAKTAEAQERLRKLRTAMIGPVIDRLIDQEANVTLANLKQATPTRWNLSGARAAWQIAPPKPGRRVIFNPNRVMGFLERGTANKGRGYIRPAKIQGPLRPGQKRHQPNAKLFVPLTRRAAVAYATGARIPLKYGVDYVLAPRVRGIKPRNIARNEQKAAQVRLKARMKQHIREAING